MSDPRQDGGDRRATTGAVLRDRWRALASAESEWLAPREMRARIASGQVGTPVVLYAAGPVARMRTRHAARAGGLAVERELLVLPGLRHPLYLVEDAPESVRWFAREVLAVPPRVPFQAAAYAAVALLRTSWRLWRLAAPGRLLVGRPA